MVLQIRRPLGSLCNQNLRLHLQKPFSIFEPSSFFSTSEPDKSASRISTADYLTNRLNVSPEIALKVSSYRSRLKNPERADSVIEFLKDVGFTRADLELALGRSPRLLFSSVDNIRPKIKILQDAGLCDSLIVKIVSTEPLVLTMSADNRLSPSVEALKNILGSFEDVEKVLGRCGWFLKSDLEKSLLPNVEKLRSCGVPSRQLSSYLVAFPRMFLIKPAQLEKFMDRVDEMGVERGSPMFLPAIRTVSSMSPESWEQKLGVFRSLGFSDEDILSIFRRAPLALTVSERKIKEVSRILLETGGANLALLVSRPELFTLSPERRLKPRLGVLKILESKDLLKKKPKLISLCKMTENVFMDKYVLPHLDAVREAYRAVNSSLSTD